MILIGLCLSSSNQRRFYNTPVIFYSIKFSDTKWEQLSSEGDLHISPPQRLNPAMTSESEFALGNTENRPHFVFELKKAIHAIFNTFFANCL
jgi:hypothetical protein